MSWYIDPKVNRMKVERQREKEQKEKKKWTHLWVKIRSNGWLQNKTEWIIHPY